MSKWQMEIFENYDDGLNDAQLFRIYREIFKSKEEEKKRFNSICNKIKDDILTVFDATNLEMMSKYESLPCHAKKTFLRKKYKAKLFLEKKENGYKFNDWIKQIIINLLYGDEISKLIRYSRDANDFNKGAYYYKLLVHFHDWSKPKDIKLYYYTFLFIIDSLNFLEIIDHKIGFYDDEEKQGMESRMVFSDYGMSLFTEIKEDKIFESIEEQDLIVKTERISKKGKGDKFFTKVIKYTDSVEIRRQKEFIKKVNKIYQESNLTVKVENIVHKKVSFVDDLYVYRKNNSINLKEFDCEIIENLEIEKKYRSNTKLRYYDKFTSIADNSISITDKKTKEYNRQVSEYLSLLIQILGMRNESKWLHPQNGNAAEKENDLLKINKMCFEINKKSMFRVYSRNSWSMHGRWYGGL